jgi:hypothetical protein
MVYLKQGTEGAKIMERLIETLRLLSSNYEGAKKILPDGIILADEIALLFDDMWQYCPYLKEDNLITDRQYQILSEIDRELDSMSDVKELWTDTALKDNEKWKNIREYSNRALEEFGKGYCSPHIDWAQFNFPEIDQ